MAIDAVIDRSARHDEVLAELSGAGKAFQTMRETLLFAAGLGYSIGRTEELGRKGESIRYAVFQNKEFAPDFIQMLASLVTQDPEIVLEQNFTQAAAIFSGYAAGGLDHVIERASGNTADFSAVVHQILNEKLIAGAQKTK